MKTNKHTLLAAAALLLPVVAQAQVGTATFITTGNWTDSSRWSSSPAGFAPVNGNNGQNWNASVGGGITTVNASVTIQSLTFTAGNIQGANTLTMNAASTWSGGTFSTSGGITNFNDGVTITANGQALSSRTVNLVGTSSIGNGSIILNGSGSLVNNGSFNINSTTTLNFDASFSAGFLINNGTLNKTGAGAVAVIGGASYYNDGTMNIDQGSFTTSNGGSASGTFDIDAGAQFGVSSGSFSMSDTAKIHGAGLFNLTGGTTTFSGTNSGSSGNLGIGGPFAGGIAAFASGAAFSTSGGLTMTNGKINGAGTVSFNAPSTWSGGHFETTGGVTNLNGGVTITANGQYISQRTVNMHGTSTIGSGTLGLVNSANWVNHGTFNINNAATLNFDGSFSVGYLTNNGTINKSGSGTVAFVNGGRFSNPGTLNVTSGTFSPIGMPEHSGTSLIGGTWNVSNGANLNFVGGSNITTIGSGANVTLDGVGSTFAKINTLTTNQGGFTLKNDRDFTTANAFTNSGTISVQDSGTALKIGATGNLAYTQTGGVTAMVGGAFIDPGVFNLNGGMLRGTGTIESSVIAGAGSNTIAPGLSPGTLTINGSLTLSGTSTLAMEIGGRTQGSLYDHLDVNGVLTLAGLLDLDFINTFETSVNYGDIFTLATTDSDILGSFSNIASGSRLGTNFIHTFEVWYGAGSPYGANNLVITGAPEPSRALLLLAGTLGLMLRRQRAEAEAGS